MLREERIPFDDPRGVGRGRLLFGQLADELIQGKNATPPVSDVNSGLDAGHDSTLPQSRQSCSPEDIARLLIPQCRFAGR